MVASHLDIHRVLTILETLGVFTCTWPSDGKTRGFKLFLRNLYRAIIFVIMILLTVSQGLFVYYNLDNIVPAMKSLSTVTTFVEASMNFILCRHLDSRLKIPVAKLKKFVSTAKTHEKIVLQKYIDRYTIVYEFIVASFVLCGLAFAMSPLFLHTEYPLDAVFPFPTDSLFVKCVLYVVEFIGISHVVSNVTVDLTTAMFLWYVAARLDMLILDLKNVTEDDQLIPCIKQHQQLIQFMKETESAVQVLIFKTNVTMALTVIAAAIPLLGKQSFAVVSQFAPMVVGAMTRLYIIAWPADDLKAVSEEVAFWTYSAAWVGKSKSMGKNMCMMIGRSHNALVLSIMLLPSPSFAYYAAFLKTISSYFMGIRTIIGD